MSLPNYDAWKLKAPNEDEPDEDEEETDDYCSICGGDPCGCDEIYEREMDREYDDD